MIVVKEKAYKALNALLKFLKKLFYIYLGTNAFIGIAIGSYVFIRIQYYKWNTEKVYEKNGVSVYWDSDYPKSDTACLLPVLDRSLALLREKGISCEKNINLVFYYYMEKYDSKVNSFGANSNAKACTFSVGRISMFSAVRFCDDVFDGDDWIETYDFFSKNPASSTIAHELCHIYEYEKLGAMKYCMCSLEEEWKIEGFADYVSEKSLLKVDKGIELFIEGDNGYIEDVEGYIVERAILYFFGRLRTDYLLRHKGIPEDEYWDTNYDTDKLDDEIREALRSGEYKAFEQ